jgi:hypothetical protein
MGPDPTETIGIQEGSQMEPRQDTATWKKAAFEA